MALFVVLKSTNMKGKQNHVELHVPFHNLPTLVNEEIDHIQADCDELDAIQRVFHFDGIFNIPMPNGKRVVRWYGDIAKTIYFNL